MSEKMKKFNMLSIKGKARQNITCRLSQTKVENFEGIARQKIICRLT